MDAEYSIVFLFLFVLKMPSIKYIHHYYHHQPSTSCCTCRQYEHAECGAGGRAALGTQAHWGRGARSQGEQGQPRQQGGGEGARGGPHQLHQRQGCWHHVAPGEHLSPVCRAAALYCAGQEVQVLLNSPRPRLHLVLCKQRRRLGSTGGLAGASQEHSGHQTTQRQVGPTTNSSRGLIYFLSYQYHSNQYFPPQYSEHWEKS